PVFHLAEGGGGSLARSAGIGGHHAGGVSQAARFRGGAAEGDSRCPLQRATGRVLRLPQRERGHWQERHRQYAGILRAPAGGEPRGSSAGRSVRHQPPYPHFLRDLAQGTGSRVAAHPPVYCEKLVVMEQPIRLTPSLREKVWGKTRLAPWYPDSETPIGEAWFLSPRELPLLVKMGRAGRPRCGTSWRRRRAPPSPWGSANRLRVNVCGRPRARARWSICCTGRRCRRARRILFRRTRCVPSARGSCCARASRMRT